MADVFFDFLLASAFGATDSSPTLDFETFDSFHPSWTAQPVSQETEQQLPQDSSFSLSEWNFMPSTSAPVPTASAAPVPLPTASEATVTVPTAPLASFPVPTTPLATATVPTGSWATATVPTASRATVPVPTASWTTVPVPTASWATVPVPTVSEATVPVPTVSEAWAPASGPLASVTPMPREKKEQKDGRRDHQLSKRERNNVAVKKCREKAKAKHKRIAEKLEATSAIAQRMRSLLNQIAISPDLSNELNQCLDLLML